MSGAAENHSIAKLLQTEKNKEEKTKKSSDDLESVSFLACKFFDSFEFLKDNLVARPTKSNLEDDDSLLSNSSIYNSDNPPSAKSVGKMVKGQQSSVEEVMATATKVLDKT